MKYTPLFSCESWITQFYGRTAFAKNYYKLGRHLGLDIVPKDRSSWELYAPFNGEVAQAGWDDSYGCNVTLYSDKLGVSLRFAHLDETLCQEGDSLLTGVQFGIGGNTGNSTARHVHVGFKPMRPYGNILYGGNPNYGTVNPLGLLIGLGVHI